MKTFRSFSATLTLASLIAVSGVGTANADESGPAKANCRQETKRVAVWPRTAPKAPAMARFEDRQVTVCDSKAAAKRAEEERLQAQESGN